ncbi:THO complex subunit 5 like protein [Verticillium longisporum]|uniref:THO complex subunit 5 like protein n=1 Tax=Verticillium longisporum TaxID=100787 RepID=A0A8I3AYK2_VERLO|nr:THO complex subunit 5 like protein [Verticillium longisporum]
MTSSQPQVSDLRLDAVLRTSAESREQADALVALLSIADEAGARLPADLEATLSKQQKLLFTNIAHLRGLHRAAHFSARETKATTAEDRQAVDTLHLQLQNLYYEQRHLQGEIAACDEYDRRAGGLAMIALLALSYWVISRASAASHLAYAHNFRHPGPQPAKGPTSFFAKDWPTIVFAYYCLFIHFLVFAFPFRSCYAVISMTWNLKKTALNKRLRDFKFAHRRRGSSSSLSSSETLTSYYACSSITSQPGDPQVEAYSESSDYAVDHVIHAIIIPNYKEEVDTLRETLDVLASHPQAVNSYDDSR